MADPRFTVHLGDNLPLLKSLPDNSVDSVVTDPPCGINFMGAEFDSDKGGRDHWIAWMTEIAKECFRVIKPGGHALVWALPRTSHWTAMGWENAGWEPRDKIVHLQGEGFPKSHNISKALDKMDKWDAKLRFVEWMQTTGLKAPDIDVRLKARGLILESSSFAQHFFNRNQPLLPTTRHWGVIREMLTGTGVKAPEWIDEAIDLRENGSKTFKTREVVGEQTVPVGHAFASDRFGNSNESATVEVTVPVTDLAKQWEGWGTCLKPSSEDWWLFRKPCDHPTVAANVATHGTGALNIDATRVRTNPNDPILESRIAAGRGFGVNARIYGKPGIEGAPAYDPSKGRWPANTVLSHTELCRQVGTRKVKTSMAVFRNGLDPNRSGGYGGVVGKGIGLLPPTTPDQGYADADGMETVAKWECPPGCPVRVMDEQSGDSTSTTGGGGGWKDTYVGEGSIVQKVSREGYEDAGGASRFFNTFGFGPDDDITPFIYVPKPSQAERHEGLEGDGNTHITVKSKALMLHLVSMITPPGGTVLDPFTGSGTTGVAVMYHSPTTKFIGMEMDPVYHGIATARIAYHLNKSMGGLPRNPFTAPVVEAPVTTLSLDDLFGGTK